MKSHRKLDDAVDTDDLYTMWGNELADKVAKQINQFDLPIFQEAADSTFSADSEAMGFLLQITMSYPCALSRQVAGAGRRCWCCELAVCTWWRQIAGAGWCWAPGAGAAAGAVS